MNAAIQFVLILFFWWSLNITRTKLHYANKRCKENWSLLDSAKKSRTLVEFTRTQSAGVLRSLLDSAKSSKPRTLNP